MNSFNNKTNEYLTLINKQLDAYVKPTGKEYDIIKQAMGYSLNAGGKRIRAILLLEFCKITGGNIKTALPLASAVEMIHGYSLIHDDLPCMDDDDFRRGQPSCHIKFGEANALLAGDALLTLAFEVIATSDDINADIVKKAIKILSKNAGADGMIAGQVLDLANENKQINEQMLLLTHKKKTGALIKAACMLGAIASQSNEEIILKCGEYGENVGLAFQIIDDILDVTSTQEQLGKPINSDEQSRKTTFVGLYGLEKAKAMAQQKTAKALDILQQFSNNDYLECLTNNLLERKY